MKLVLYLTLPIRLALYVLVFVAVGILFPTQWKEDYKSFWHFLVLADDKWGLAQSLRTNTLFSLQVLENKQDVCA